MDTPFLIMVLSATDNGQLPPCSTAKSTKTDPGFIVFIISSVTKTGAGRPGIKAVQITISCLATVDAISSDCLALYASLISFA